MSQITPAIGGVVIRSKQATAYLGPLAGDTGQAAVPTVGPWVLVPPGSYLDAQLVVTTLLPAPGTTSPGGALTVHVETCDVVVAGVSIDGPRALGCFRGAPSAALPSTQPFVGAGVTGNYIRVISTPAPANTNCVWSVTGNLICAAYAQTT